VLLLIKCWERNEESLNRAGRMVRQGGASLGEVRRPLRSQHVDRDMGEVRNDVWALNKEHFQQKEQ
jgi:hypothetical protein